MKNKILFLLISVLSVLLIIGCSSKSAKDNSESTESSSGDERIDMDVVFAVADDHLVGIGANMFRDLVEERLDGKVNVKLHSNGSLFDIEDGTEALQSGNVEVVIGSTSKLVGYDPAYQLYDMPFLFDSVDHVNEFNETDEGKELLSRVESSNLIILKLWPGAFSQLTNNKHPIEKPEDMKKLKFRVMSGGLLADQFDHLGAGATVIPYSDLYMSLQQGVVDGQENPFLEIATANLYEVQDYMTITNHKLATYPFITNKDFWEGLPEEMRSELETILEEVTNELEVKSEEIDAELYEEIKNSGQIEILELDDDQRLLFEEQLESLYEEYEDILGKDLIEKAQSLK